MTVIIFLLDTSASMAQKNYKGCSTLDICKNFIYEFVKARGRDASAKMYDRYVLLTTEDNPSCYKELRSPWRENVLMDSLKQVEAHGRHNFTEGLKNVFKLVNAHRNTTGIETYGYGRTPYYIEPVIIVSMTDGFGISELPQDIKVEEFDTRWDQRLFTLVLRLPAQSNRFPGRVDPDQEHIEKLCANNGGRSFSVVNHKQMSSCFDQIFQSFSLLGVGVRFSFPTNLGPSKTDRVPTQSELVAEARLRKDLESKPIITLLVRNAQGKPVPGHWPIPEAFWHTRLENGNLPARSCHPTVLFMMEMIPVHMMADYPFDKYDLEPSCLSDFVIERFKNIPDKCLQVFVRNSGKIEGGVGKPFGFLKPNSAGTAVTLFIMPYNYPVILSLVEECKADPNVRNNPNWRKRLDNYLDTVPPYYISNLKKTLVKFGISGGLLDDPTVNKRMYAGSSVSGMFNRLKAQGLEEWDRLQSAVSHASKLPAPQAQSQMTQMERRPKLSSRRHWKTECDAASNRSKKGDKDRDKTSDRDMVFRDLYNPSVENGEKLKTQVHFADSRVRVSAGSIFKNPFTIPKTDLISQIPRLNANMGMFLRNTHFSLLEGGRAGFSIKLHNADELHNLPISVMGNYDDYIKAKISAGGAPLREIDPKPVRSNAFGSPFKTKGISVDEVGENTLTPVEQNGTKEHKRRDRGRPPKRKAGPLATHAMRDWRDKRKSNSECSSMVSDLSYATDLDVEMPGCSTSSLVENGHMETEENNGGIEEAPQPTSVQTVEPIDNDIRLSDSEMRARKIEISSIVRRPGNGLVLFRELAKRINDGNANDRCLLLQHALRESLRFKRKGLSADIQVQIDQFKSVLKPV